MSDLNVLIAQKESILLKIREIEETCEGIENENNARQIQKLNEEKTRLIVKKNQIQTEINII